jgi:dTDP-4-dehydrorhamnose reductase
MTWLITGGSGQLGIAISRELSDRNLLFKSCGSKDLDITEPQQVTDLISILQPEVIVNCAAWTDVDAAEKYPERAFRINSYGAQNIAIAARKNDCKLIQLSTDYVFAGDPRELLEVDFPTNPESVYGRTKADGEKLVINTYPERSYIVRTAWLYSPWGKNFAKSMTTLALSGEKEVRVVDDQIGQPTSAIDLAAQIVELALSDSPAGIYHGTNSGETSRFHFAREIFRLAGVQENYVVPVPTIEYQQEAKRPSRSVLGQKSWEKSELQPMRNWKEALASAMPAIISSTIVSE